MQSIPGNDSELMTDQDYQNIILKKVARTFALTIPQMPIALREAVSNAYLLCRITDTIEDETNLTPEQKLHFSQIFSEVIRGRASAGAFAEALHPLLSESMSIAERDLVKNTARIVRLTHGFPASQQTVIQRCVAIMASGMAYFQLNKSCTGLHDLMQMNRYCYYVAGAVGEMLTELCSQYSTEINERRQKMMVLAVSFGQGLQMTNILKDIWEDKKRGACWLPQDIFKDCGYDLSRMSHPEENQASFICGLEKLIAIAHAHLRNALEYVLLIPKREIGLRRFCLWAIGMALLTLRRIHKTPGFRSGQEVKISRRSVALTMAVSNLSIRSDRFIKFLFKQLARSLPAPVYHYYDDRIQDWRSVASEVS